MRWFVAVACLKNYRNRPNFPEFFALFSNKVFANGMHDLELAPIK